MKRALLLCVVGVFAAACDVALAAEGCTVANGDVRIEDTVGAFPEIDQKLGKGLSVTIVHEVQKPGAEPAVFGCKVFYDLWDTAYGVTTFRDRVDAAGTKTTVRDKKDLVKLCHTGRVPFKVAGGDRVEVTTYLDPVSDEQLAKTRKWLAEKGIGARSGAFLGRAAYAIVDLKQQKVHTRSCRVSGGGK